MQHPTISAVSCTPPQQSCKCASMNLVLRLWLLSPLTDDPESLSLGVQVHRRPASSSAAPSEHSATSEVLVDSLQRAPAGNEVIKHRPYNRNGSQMNVSIKNRNNVSKPVKNARCWPLNPGVQPPARLSEADETATTNASGVLSEALQGLPADSEVAVQHLHEGY